MKILNQLPPNIEILRKVFQLQGNTVFTYGDTIYNPGGGFIDSALMAHEETHMMQQEEMGIEKWWDLYIANNDFRLSQEIPAYQNQYKVLKRIFKDRNKLDFYVRHIVADLSGPMYGNLLSRDEASKAIKSEKKFEFDTSNFKQL